MIISQILLLKILYYAVTGWTTFWMGTSMFTRSQVRGYGWMFPLAVFTFCTGLNMVLHAVLNAGIGESSFFRDEATIKVFGELLMMTGFTLSYIRIKQGVLTNSIIKWGWVLCIGVGAVVITAFAVSHQYITYTHTWTVSTMIAIGYLVLALAFRKIKLFHLHLIAMSFSYVVGSMVQLKVLPEEGYLLAYGMRLVSTTWILFWMTCLVTSAKSDEKLEELHEPDFGKKPLAVQRY